MRRRAFLRRAGAITAGLALPAGSGAGQEAETGTPTYTPRQTTPVAEGTAPLGRLSVESLKEAVTSPDGGTAYCATGDGFAVVDITDPAAPEVLVDERDPLADREATLFDVYDVKLDAENDLLAVVSPANPAGSEVFRGLLVYDVSAPTDPERVTTYETDFFNHNCFATGGHVYLCANRGSRNGLLVVDARTGETVGEWSLADRDERWSDVRLRNWVLHDVSVHDGTAFLAYWDAGTVLLDVSDPTEPAFLARIGGQRPGQLASLTSGEASDESLEPPGNDHYTATNDDGTLLGVGVESWDADPADEEGGPGGITLYDISDPTAPEALSVIDPPPTPDPAFRGVWTTSHNFSFRGDRLYTSWYRGGVRVYDVSDPTDPALLARWRDSYETSFWTAEPAGDRDFFVAPSWKGWDDDEGVFGFDEAALYTFSDPAAGPTGTPTAPTSSDGQPGFGPLAALAGLGAGAWYALSRRRRADGPGDRRS
jgi:PGF-CTERM protein